MLVLEIGLFSKLPTGFRILNMTKNDTKRVPLDVAKKHLNDVLRSLSTPTLTDRKAAVQQALEKVLV